MDTSKPVSSSYTGREVERGGWDENPTRQEDISSADAPIVLSLFVMAIVCFFVAKAFAI